MSPNRVEAHAKFFLALFLLIILPALFALVDHELVVWLVWPRIHGLQHIYYHHGYPASDYQRSQWGSNEAPFYTNSLAMKDASIRHVDAVPSGRRVVFTGDSFTEGIGQPFEKTFVGRFAANYAAPGLEALNAGVSSFSPRTYYLRTRFLLEVDKIKFDELYVFIDISDVQDEIFYEGFEPETSPSLLRRARVWLHRNSFTYRLLPRLYHNMMDRLAQAPEPPPPATKPAPSPEANRATGVAAGSVTGENPLVSLYVKDPELRSSWTFRPDLMERGGQHGLDLATKNMGLLADLCQAHGIKLTIAVYPWPHQIRAHDLDSIQVRHWRDFAAKRGLNFINYFPLFIGRPEETDATLKKYFNDGDPSTP